MPAAVFLLESGIEEKKVSNVVGKADTENLNPKDPLDPQNRRISVVLLRESLTKQSVRSIRPTTRQTIPAIAAHRVTFSFLNQAVVLEKLRLRAFCQPQATDLSGHPLQDRSLHPQVLSATYYQEGPCCRREH